MTDPIKYKLAIDNFQGIKHAEVELGGFVSIQGETSCGKSSIRRALGAILFNDWEASYLNNMSDKCVLTLARYEVTDGSDDGSDIEAYRATTIVKYTRTANSIKYYLKHNGNEFNFDKPGASVPQEIQEALGITMLDCDKETYNIHVSRQQTVEPLFMIAFNEAQNTRILNRVFNVTKYEVASQLCNRDIRNFNSTIKVKQEAVDNNSKEVEAKQLKHKKLIKQIRELQSLYSKIKLITEYAGKKLEIISATQRLNEIKLGLDRVNKAENLLVKFNVFNSYVSKLKETRANKAELEKTLKEITLSKKASAILIKLDKISNFESLAYKLNEAKSKIKSISESLSKSDCIATILKKLQLLDRPEEIWTRLKSIKSEIANIDQMLIKSEAAIAEIGICPYCNSKIEHSH